MLHWSQSTLLLLLLLLLLCPQEKPDAEECGKFGKLWKEFGRALKLGIVEDNNNRWVFLAGGGACWATGWPMDE
jgi:hypothetical protein